MSDKTQWKTWSLISRMRLGLVLLFVPILILGAIYYYHMTVTLQRDLQQQLVSKNDQLHNVLIKPYLDTLTTQFELIYRNVDYKDFIDNKIKHQSEYLKDWRLFHLQFVCSGTQRAYPSYQLRYNGLSFRPLYSSQHQHGNVCSNNHFCATT